MTQPLPSLPASATPQPRPSAEGAVAAGAATGFDGMLREQMGPPSAEQAEAGSAAGEVVEAILEPAAPPAGDGEPSSPAAAVAMLEQLTDAPQGAAATVAAAPEAAEPALPARPAGGATPQPAIADPAAVAAPVVAMAPAAAGPVAATGAEPAAAPGPRIQPGAAAATRRSDAMAPAARATAGQQPVFPAPAGVEGAAGAAIDALAESLEAPAATRAAAPTASAPGPLAGAATSAVPVPGAPRVQVLEPVTIPVADPDWGGAVGARLLVSAVQGVQSASIALNPQELGPLQLTLTVNEDEASVSFVSNHAAVRDAIEAALPRLREMLAGQGIVLADVDVSAGGDRSRDGQQATPGDGGRSGDPAAHDAHPDVPLRISDGLVDTFA